MTDILNIKDAWKTYKMGAEEINALQGVNFKVEKGGFPGSHGTIRFR